jgi:nicotinamide-nucleotide amidase
LKVAEIVSVGTELLMGQIADTNAQYLGAFLPELGIAHHHRQTVGDNLDRLTAALSLALSRSDIVFTIGGLGPTQDDLTREGIAAALHLEMEYDDSVVERIRKAFALRNIPFTASQARQGYRPIGSFLLDNPNGTAPGIVCEKDGKAVIALPGPKGEFIPMVDGPLRDYLAKQSGEEVIHSHLLRICGMGESMVEEKIRPLLESTNPTVAPYAKPGEVHLRITAKAPNVQLAEALIAPFEERVRAVLGDAIFGAGDVTLEYATLDLLKARNRTLAVAESLTGGLLGGRVCSVPGASGVFQGGVITYAKEMKSKFLGVDKALLDDPKIGPVSAEVASQMAIGVRREYEADYGVSVTGNAGPTSDEGGKPVGLVYIGVAGPAGVEVEEHRFRGLREDIRARSAQFALTMLRRILLQTDPC